MTGRAEKEKKRKERTESRKSQRGVGKSLSQEEKELEAYKKHYKETMKNWNHNTMKMYPPTPAEWQRNKQYYPSKFIADEIKKLGIGGKTISNQDFRNLLIDLGLTASQQKKLSEQLKDKKYTVKSKKGKPHLKYGGKAKKKYGVVGKPTLRKGGKA